MVKYIILSSFLLFVSLLYSQKKAIDFDTHFTWKSVSSVEEAKNGTLVTYQINPYIGDGKLFIQHPSGRVIESIDRAKNQKVHHKGAFTVFKIENYTDSVWKLKIDEVKKDKWPKDSLGIHFTAADSITKIADVKSFKLSEKGDWLAFLMENNDEPNPPAKKYKGILWWKKEVKEEKVKSKGNRLVLYNPISGDSLYRLNVKDYGFDENGTSFYYTTHHQPKKDSINSYYMNLQGERWELFLSEGHTNAKHYSFDEEGQQLAFLASSDTVKENKVYQLYYFNKNNKKTVVLVDSLTDGAPEGQTVSEHQRPYFSKSGKRLFLGVEDIPRQEEKDTIPKDEMAKLDIWHWQDDRTQPEQLLRKKSDQMYSALSYFDFDSKKVIVLGNDTLKNVRVLEDGDGDYAYVSYRGKYDIERSWAWPWQTNYYRIDMKSGEAKPFLKGTAFGLRMHPEGKMAAYYEPKDSSWHVIDENGNNDCLTFFIEDQFAEDVNGMPTDAGPQGFYGWTEDGKAIIYSENHIYSVDAEKPKNFQCLTKGLKEEEHKFRLVNTHRDSNYVYPLKDFVVAENVDDRSTSIFKDLNSKMELLSGDFMLARNYIFYPEYNRNLVFLRRMNLETYPDLEVIDLGADHQVTKLSEANPQQKDYLWANMEKFEYVSLIGDTLPALIYYPENLDKSKKYPVIFYYYEKYQGRTHIHYMPRPSASVINFTEFASNDYIVVVPDIKYEPGHPAQSAYDCIMGVTNTALKKYPFIDSTKMGLQGQSWGGYQTAQLITMTDRYAAAGAGAPVSNMFSAYGGIRWGSGLSREFQYERTQSRIGGTIWEVPELYTENSPLFGLPNVKTPVLIMHNDNDGAVPWYQGIEMFMGLRRLGKPAWLLNYNGDKHNLMKIPNRRDLSKRLMQFFDTFLKDEPAPEWIEKGIPAAEKGDNYGFEVLDDKK